VSLPVRARHCLLVFLLVLTPALAHATIGDDLPTLRREYGSAKEVGGQMLFQHEGYSITVAFEGTRAAMEIFLRDGSIPSKPDMTQQDVDAILVVEGAGQTWNPVNTPSGQPMWVRADNKVVARFNPSEKIMTVMLNAR
jgi:hypothetical protein